MINSTGALVPDLRSPKERAWDRVTTIPLIVLSFIFLLAYSILILDDQAMNGPFDRWVIWILLAVWAIFILDFFVRFTLTNNKRKFIPRNFLDFLSVFIPFFRPFLLLVYLGRLRFFAAKTGSSIRVRVATYAASFAVMYIYVLSLAVLAAERHAPGATITTYGDSVWWAFETISTVGYGDMIPVTVQGRFYAVLLMLGGMVIVGATTATVVSYFNEKVQEAHKRNQAIHHAPDAKADVPGDAHPHA